MLRGRWGLLSRHESFSTLVMTPPGRRILCRERFVDKRLLGMLETFSLEGDNKHWRPSPKETETKMLEVTTLFSQLLVNPSFLENMTQGSKVEGAESGTGCSRILRDLLLFQDSPFSNYR